MAETKGIQPCKGGIAGCVALAGLYEVNDSSQGSASRLSQNSIIESGKGLEARKTVAGGERLSRTPG